MTIRRMDNVAIVVEDLGAAVAFFAELGLEEEGRADIEGAWADEAVGLDGVRSQVVMMSTPDGHGRLELTRYEAPEPHAGAAPPPHTVGLHRVMFAVDDVEETVRRLEGHGARLLGGIARYSDQVRLCYLRGPSGIVVALAEGAG